MATASIYDQTPDFNTTRCDALAPRPGIPARSRVHDGAPISVARAGAIV